MGDEFAKDVLNLSSSDRQRVCGALLQERYTDTFELLSVIQRLLDRSTGVQLAPQKPEYPAERVQQMAQSLTDETVPDETIRRRAGSTATIARSFQDAYMQENAKFRSKAGLKCYITRTGAAGCCKWCAEVAGRYAYGDEPHDVYRRHDNCDCTVTYENGRKRQDVWSKRTWEAPGADAGAEEPVRFSAEQAAELEAGNSLTKPAGSGTIFARAMQPNRRIGSDGQQVIDQPTFNRLTRDFVRRGGEIRTDEEAVHHLQDRKVHAAYLPSFNTILFSSEPTVSEVLEETYHAEQDRLHLYGEIVTPEVRLRREIDAQKYLLSLTERYKIPDDEVLLTQANLEDYERELEALLKSQRGERNE